MPKRFGRKKARDAAETVEGTLCESEAALFESIEEVRKSWQDAKSMFEFATEKDSIDALIHKIDAYEREYIYLLKLARKENLSAFPEIK